METTTVQPSRINSSASASHQVAHAPGCASSHTPRHTLRAGFSLIELIVVIAVATLMTGLLMPALRHVHENAHRIICMSHLNQMGQAFVMYTMENKEWLPYSAVLHTGDYPSNLMIARRGGTNGNWDGLGLLYSQGFCPSPECFYCPSHHGNHDYEQYADRWQKPVPGQSIFANYHYAGDIEWANKGKRRTLDDGPNFALASDGLRTVGDFNHFDGMNILRGDGSVYWRDDAQDIIKTLPLNDTNPPAEVYTLLWEQLLDHH